MASTKVYRPCDQCGGVDDHPRHSFAGEIPGLHVPGLVARPGVDGAYATPTLNAAQQQAATARAAELEQTTAANLSALVDAGTLTMTEAFAVNAMFRDTASTDRHIDCCAAAGCPLAGTPDGCDARVAVWNGKPGAGMVKAAEKVRADNPDHYATAEG